MLVWIFQLIKIFARTVSVKQNKLKVLGDSFPLKFTGGLDSTVLACLADRCLDDSEPLDLLNVAFEQPDGSFDVPDRVTALRALAGNIIKS
jgi:asparagine synthetase B (glutamine-hydrolysing)